jgi:chromosomal replication initiation ATPase DnaA
MYTSITDMLTAIDRRIDRLRAARDRILGGDYIEILRDRQVLALLAEATPAPVTRPVPDEATLAEVLITETSRATGVRPAVIRSRCKASGAVLARAIVYGLLHHRAGRSLMSCAREMGRTEHSAAMHSVRHRWPQVLADEVLRAAAAQVEREVWGDNIVINGIAAPTGQETTAA